MTKQTIPHRVRGIAREAYRHAVMTGQTVQHRAHYKTVVAYGINRVIVTMYDNSKETAYPVPVAKSWIGE